MPTTASGIARDHLEAFLAAWPTGSPPTVAKHYRSLQQLLRALLDTCRGQHL